MSSVKLEKVSKSYDGVLWALRSIECTIKEGEFAVIIGPSGCGKSTLLNLIAGLEKVTDGKIYLNNKCVNDTEPKNRNIAMVFQNHTLYPHLTVYNNLAFTLKIRHEKKSEIKRKVQDVAKMLDIDLLLDRKPNQLSGGQKQRVAIGRAIVSGASVFLMDEPLSNLDAQLKIYMREELKHLQKKLGLTFIYVTHDQIEAMTLATTLIVMKNGEIQQIGSPFEIFFNPRNIFVAQFIGSYPINLTKGIVRKNGLEEVIFFWNNHIKVKFLKQFDGKEVMVGVRPEGLTVCDKGEIKVTVEETEILGVNTMLRCKCKNGDLVCAVVETTNSMKYSENIFLKINWKMLYVFDCSTKERIEVVMR